MALSFGGKSLDPRGYWTLPKKIKPKVVAAPAVTPTATAARPTRAVAPTALLPEGAPAARPLDESWKDQAYFDSTAGVSRNLDNLRGYLINSGKGLGADYGIDFDGDPVTGAKNFRIADNVDVTNPFSRAALLKRSYQQAQTGNTTSYAARGQLYSGALQNAQNETGRQNLQSQDALIKDFAGRFGGLYQTWLEGQSAASQQGIDAQTAAQGRHQGETVVVPSSVPSGPVFSPAAIAALTKPPVAKPVVVAATSKTAEKARKKR